jgi:hypothetical protein
MGGGICVIPLHGGLGGEAASALESREGQRIGLAVTPRKSCSPVLVNLIGAHR